jgi:hypothetical protein
MALALRVHVSGKQLTLGNLHKLLLPHSRDCDDGGHVRRQDGKTFQMAGRDKHHFAANPNFLQQVLVVEILRSLRLQTGYLLKT